MRVAVVGAGVLGSSVAYELARAGAQVTLVDAGGPAAGTSARGAGLVCEGMWHSTSLALVLRSMDIFREADVGFTPTGSTTLVPAGLVEPARRMAAFQRHHGAEVREVDPATLEGVRTDDVALALRYPRDGWAHPPRLCERRWAEIGEAGGEVVRAPAALRREGARVRLEVAGRAREADAVVLAAGVWTRALLRQAGLDAPLAAYRTQAQRFAVPSERALPMLHDAVQGFYLRPGAPGEILVGNGTTTTPEDPDAFRREADPAFREACERRLAHRFPGLRAAPGEAWAGVDAATPDRLMLAGPHPDAPEVWLLAGGNGHGFMRAPAAGEALAARMLGSKPRVDLAPLDPARFAGRLGEPFAIREGYTLES